MLNKNLSCLQHCDQSKRVRSDKVRELGKKIMLFHREKFAFAKITPTLHQMCAHTFELFEINKEAPISVYSEQPSESWHKYLRAFQSGTSSKARQMSLHENIQDIFYRMLITTHPTIVCTRLMLYCTFCSEYGHTMRGCGKRKSTVLSEEDSDIMSFFY